MFWKLSRFGVSIEGAAGGRLGVDASLVRQLLDTQCPQWAQLPLKLFEPAGSDHVIYRLGDELSVRLPRRPGHNVGLCKESVWLPQLAPHLPLDIPVHLFVGEPDFGFPFLWSVARRLPGTVATSVEGLGDSTEAAHDVAGFLAALQQFKAIDLPPGDITEDLLTERPIGDRDLATRMAVAQVSHVFPTAAMTDLWDAALSAPDWDSPPVWFHGDFHAGNLLTTDGRISAVIDFGALGIGDPACDVAGVFGLLSARTRDPFRRALDVDDATWARARGLALAYGLNAYTAYAATNPRIAAQTTRQIMDALIG